MPHPSKIVGPIAGYQIHDNHNYHHHDYQPQDSNYNPFNGIHLQDVQEMGITLFLLISISPTHFTQESDWSEEDWNGDRQIVREEEKGTTLEGRGEEQRESAQWVLPCQSSLHPYF